MFLSSNLQYLRRNCDGMTQEKLAQRMGVSRQTVSKWESGEAYPEIGNLLELCDIFDCSLDALVRENMVTPKPSGVRLLRVEAFRMAQYVIISRQAKKDVLAYMDRWADSSGLRDALGNGGNCIHWGFPYVSAEQKNRFGFQGHGAAYILPENFEPNCDGAEIIRQKEAVYAVMTVQADGEGQFPDNRRMYPVIMEYLANNGIRKSLEDGVLPAFEREYQKEGIRYKDVFIHCAADTSAEPYKF